MPRLERIEVIKAERTVQVRFPVVRLLLNTSKRQTLGVAMMVLLGGILPVGFIFAAGILIASVPAVIEHGLFSPDGQRLGAALVTATALFVFQQALEPYRTVLSTKLGRAIERRLRRRTMEAAISPVGIQHLEDPSLLDKVALARGIGEGPYTPQAVVMGLANKATFVLRGVLSAALVGFYFHWGIAFLLLATWGAVRARLWRDFKKALEVRIDETSALRRSTYFRDLITTSTAAKETRIFGLNNWILEQFTGHWLHAMREVWQVRRRGKLVVAVAVLLVMSVNFLAFVYVGRAALRGQLPFEYLAITVQAILGVLYLCNIDDNDLMVAYGSLPIPAVSALEEALKSVSLPEGRKDPDAMPRSRIVFEGVSFTYPGTDRLIYRGLDLIVPAGRSLAIVGPNGAGKTTLVKLLSRMYDPTEGRITVDGFDLRAFDATKWQRRVAAIFQDFVRYELRVTDNVGFGAVEQMTNGDGLRLAAERAGASELISSLPDGWETVLSRQFSGGVDLSGGQWQRIALARMLFAVSGGAGVLILDEPTANLDVRAEIELFDSFLALTKGLTTILISHRFSTVRKTDCICVIESGQLTERGTHEELMALDGRYAKMFRLQASRFMENGATHLGPMQGGKADLMGTDA